jgi:hypothetical protein
VFMCVCVCVKNHFGHVVVCTSSEFTKAEVNYATTEQVVALVRAWQA